MSSRQDFYQSHLNHVSRSFAFCIQQLRTPLREWVGLSYLLCRIVDTIEDSAWPNLDTQMQIFSRFDQALADASNIPLVKEWAPLFTATIPDGERALLADAGPLLEDFHVLPAEVKATMGELVLSMSQGMQHFVREGHGSTLNLSTIAQVNQYCFFVAGVVGELLAKLLAQVEPKFTLTQDNLVRAHHFGLFLQKVNMLKDQVSDQAEGRHLVPSREDLEHSAYEDAKGAIQFLMDVPLEQMEFRRFCAWSLFIGLESLLVSRHSLEENQVLKVARERKDEILHTLESLLQDQSALKGMFDELSRQLGWTQRGGGTAGALEVPDWLLKLYRGPLDRPHLIKLGVAPA